MCVCVLPVVQLKGELVSRKKGCTVFCLENVVRKTRTVRQKDKEATHGFRLLGELITGQVVGDHRHDHGNHRDGSRARLRHHGEDRDQHRVV